ncbi:MAG: hypothetical protein JWM59_198 [Verrucomicrobiales bacterium]|nr:hypothetical protein [Verrucomicrobiales bacterium]
MMGMLPLMAGAEDQKDEAIKGWGMARNPAGDCGFSVKDGKLTITVPGSDKAHDLSAELENLTAPRVLQPLIGDFRIQVKVEGEFQPGGESTQEGRTGYTGAGLVIFADSRNYVRIERASLETGGTRGPRPYINFEIRVDGQLKNIGSTGDTPTLAGKPTWLRIERKGREVFGSMSQDGVTWTPGNSKVLESPSWTTNTVLAGVAAISTSKKTFTPVYSELTITQAPPAGKPGEAVPGAPAAPAAPAVPK